MAAAPSQASQASVKATEPEPQAPELDYVPGSVLTLDSREYERPAQGGRFSKVVFLGTSSAVPQPGKRNVSALSLVLASGSQILVDCGEGTQQQVMQSKSVGLSRLDLILVTHLHGDHSFGLFGLLCSASMSGRTAPITIVGPLGIKEMVTTVLRLQGGFGAYGLHFIELKEPDASSAAATEGKAAEDPAVVLTQDGTADLGCLTDGIHITAHPLDHRVPSFGYVLTEPERAGQLDGKRARQLGAAGKQLGALKRGEDVTCEDGKVIRAVDCLGAPTPGKKIAILQDTCDSRNAEKACANCDLLIHEATYHKEFESLCVERGHSTAQMAATYAKKVNATVLALTHFSPRYGNGEEAKLGDISWLTTEAQETAPGVTVISAEDFLVIENHKKHGFRVPSGSERYDRKQ